MALYDDVRAAAERLSDYALQGNICMITYIMTQYNNQIYKDNIFTVAKKAVCANNYVAFELLMIYYYNASNNHGPLLPRTFKYLNIIESCLVCCRMDDVWWLCRNAARHGLLECIKVIRSVLNYVGPYGFLSEALIYGHVWMLFHFPKYMLERIPSRSIALGYRGIAKLCIQNNKRIFRYHNLIVNNETLLLIDYGLIDYNCFSRQATHTLLRMGYSIRNKHTH